MEELQTEVIKTQKRKNYYIQLFEIIACIFVVFIHCTFPGLFGELISAISRFAVPFFFCVSGFFLFKDANESSQDFNRRMKKKILRLLKIGFIAQVLYVLKAIAGVIIKKESLKVWLKTQFSWRHLFGFLLFNETLISGLLWFIFALIYAYVFITIFKKAFLKNAINIVFVSLIIVTYVLRYVFIKLQTPFWCFNLKDPYIFRNWLFMALPFISLGILLARYKDRIKALKISSCMFYLIVIFIGVAINVLEFYFTHEKGRF